MRIWSILILTVVAGALIAAAQQPSPGDSSTSVWSGIYTSEQAARGKALYEEHCTACHGADLRTPDGPAAGLPLAGTVFMGRWRGRNLQALFQQTRENMPLGQGGLLDDQEYIDLVSYILDVNGFGAGSTELKPEAPSLSAVVIQEKTAK